MTFVSGAFIIFICIVFCLYFGIKKDYRWIILLVASYIFYLVNSKKLAMVLILITGVAYFVGRLIDDRNSKSMLYIKENKDLTSEKKKILKQKNKQINKIILVCGVVGDLAFLFFFKYFNFFSGNASGLFHRVGIPIVLPALDLVVPIGISFYTLQAIAYMTDIYRGKYKADKNIFKFMLFMSFFPQIVQGPIARHDHIANQLYEGHEFDYKRFTFGVQLILWGFIKKLVIADRLAIPVNQIFNNYNEYTGILVLLAAVGYGLQVYADFSGGMDIARGISQVFGIDMQLNFKQPYFAKSIEEFWRRWHITLGAWMKDYIFYPFSLSKLAANVGKKARKLFGNNIGKKIPSFIAMFMVYFLVGFWHGPEWKYIFYGIWNGMFIMSGILLEDVYKKTKKKLRINEGLFSWKFFQIFRTFILCSIGRFFSRAENTFVAVFMMRAVIKEINNIAFLVDGTLIDLGLNTANWIILFLMILVMLVVDVAHERGVQIRETIARQGIVFRWFIYYTAVLVVLVFGMYGYAYNSVAFIYQQF